MPAAPSAADVVSVAVVDVGDAAAVDRFADEVVDRFGRIDLWVNNAGVLEPVGPLADADTRRLERHVRTNVLGVMHGTAVVRPPRAWPGGGGVAGQHLLGRGGDPVPRVGRATAPRRPRSRW